MRFIWLALGTICVLVGFIGAFLPILPTIPFLLLAAYFFGKSSQAAHGWLLAHETFGPVIRDWQENGSISRKSKLLSSGSMLVVIIMALLLKAPIFAVILQMVILVSVSCFIWTRPES